MTRGLDPDVLLSAELRPAMVNARRRAARDGDRQIDTAHLLHSLLESDPLVRAAFSPGQLARLLGYLVQRSIGFGLQWQASMESPLESGSSPVRRRAAGPDELASGSRGAGEGGEGESAASPWTVASDSVSGGQVRWSPTVAAALRRAAASAHARGQVRADGVDLLAALVTDGKSRAVEVLRFAGVDTERTLATLSHRP